MIEVEIRQTNMPDEPAIIATLRVDDDGTWKTTGSAEAFDRDLPVRDLHSGERLDFDDDPERWARNLSSVYRAGYLVAVITSDRPASQPG